MFENISYRFRNRNSKKNLKAKLERLDKAFQELRKETLGNNSIGWVTLSFSSATTGNSHKQTPDDSLQGQINELREYLGVEYSDSKLVPKPKEDNK